MPDIFLDSPPNDSTVESAAAGPSLTVQRKASWSGVWVWSSRGALALLDQGLISGANFIVGILLARSLAPDEYGAYALAFEAFLFLTVVYAALILEPLSVFGSSVFTNSTREYLGILLRIHIVMAMAIFVALGICAWVLEQVYPHGELALALIGVAIAAPCVLLFWLARRGFYVKLSPLQAALGALIYAVVVLGGLLIFYHYRLLSPFVAFLLMAVGSAITAPVMLVRLGVSLKLRLATFRAAEVIRRHWGYGRWALGSAVAIWFSGAIYYPVLGSFHGLADAGALKALMNFSSPVGQAFAAMSLLSLPYAARVHHQNSLGGHHHLARNLAIIYTGGTVLYWLVIVLFRQPIVRHLYAGKYLGITGLIPWVALGSVLRISATSQAVVLRAMQSPWLVFVAYVASSVVAVLVGIPCTWAFGLRGSVFALVISSALALAVASFLVYRRSSPARPIES